MGRISVDQGPGDISTPAGPLGPCVRSTGSLASVPSPPADSPADAVGDAAADAVADAVAGAVVIRPAATVMLVRDAPGATSADDRLEVLMVRRNLRSDFVGGAYVFPGGSVDPADAGPAAEAACVGRTD